MAIKSAQISVSTSATQLDTKPNTGTFSGFGLIVQNLGTASVYLGDSTVTSTAYGYELKSNRSISLNLTVEDDLYGVVASGTVTVNVLNVGV